MTSSSATGLNDWLQWLDTLSPTEIDLGLERVYRILDRLQLARPDRVVHIAGTNGKGSSAAMLESLLMTTGERIGAFTSPHVHLYNERIRVNGAAVGDSEIVSAFERIEAARCDTALTYFEFGTLAALVAFEQAGVDTAILEVGMGGRLDAVNAVDPDAGIITNVSLDHCDWLGEDIESIAAEKAGIFRGGKPFVFGTGAVPNAILAAADTLGVDLRYLGRDFNYEMESGTPARWAWSGRRVSLGSLEMPGLAGAFQLQNAAAVLALVEALGLVELLDRSLINKAFRQLELVGRCQLLERQEKWLLDVAHNAEAAGVLSRFLFELSPRGRIIAIVGMLADKDKEGIVSPLIDNVDTWIATPAQSERTVPAGELAAVIARLSDKPCLIADGVAEAVQYARRRAGADDLILVTGSFYVVGPALELIDG